MIEWLEGEAREARGRARPRDSLLQLLAHNAGGGTPGMALTPAVLQTLAQRARDIPYFAHSYSLIRNMDHGGLTPAGFAEFAYLNELVGICLHVNDGGASCLARMTPAALDAFRRQLGNWQLRLHLEISSTQPSEIDRAAELAIALGAQNIRLYARHRGSLRDVLERVYADVCHAAECANTHDLYFDYEQHEDLRSGEIAAVLHRVGDRRINALFDYTNSWNALEEPLAALRNLAPWIRQVHIKGGRKTVESDGWGQQGEQQGGPADELPSALLLCELLMLGAELPQVCCFALESEVGYYAPPFRRADEGDNPLIAYREPSETPLDPSIPIADLLRAERRWAQQQVAFNRSLGTRMSVLAEAAAVQSEPVAPTILRPATETLL